MSDGFVHCHCHSSYSLLDGLGRIDDMVGTAVALGMPALALTDHGTMFGAIEFTEKAKEQGIKPIVGCEVYVADRPLSDTPSPQSRSDHLVLLAENEVGYRNLIRLTTEAHLRGFYRKPRVDRDLLASHSEGLICLSGCMSSELARHLLSENLIEAEETASWFRDVYKDRYYLELQYHQLDDQVRMNHGIVDLSRRLGLPLVATNDVHYVEKRQAPAHEILLCVQTQTTMSDAKRMRMPTPEFYLKSADEMNSLFGSYPGAITNTLAIADRCNLEITFGRPQLPDYRTPDGQSSEHYLRELCEAGLRHRYPSEPADARRRLNYELGVINNTGFADYILLVYDVIRFARERGIGVGPGRGSAAGSIVAYCLQLTNVDPLAFGLSFERFLNVERVNMPDMDLDFADDRRDEVLRYVSEKYGADHVSQIITFGTIGARAGIRDVGRVLGMPYPDVDRVSKLIPPTCNKVSQARKDVPELASLYAGDPAIKRLLDMVDDLEGVARHASTHAAGIVISRDPLIEHVPLYKVAKTDQVTTQYAMNSIEKIGLLKLDLLGLRTLTTVQRAVEFVRQATGTEVDPDAIPLDDPEIYRVLSSGQVEGIFQVDGDGMRRLMADLQATEFEHVVALLALYRPGPMKHISSFVARKTGREEVTFDHPALSGVLESTFGIVVYQEQVMELAVKVAGYTMGEADLLRRAMGKKNAADFAQHREAFIERAVTLGTSAASASRLFDVVEPFAGYAFNKAHAACYALITCQTAYLKAHYPREFMAGLLSAERDNAPKVASAMRECSRLGIRVLPPSVNQSGKDFSLEPDGIRFGLGAIKQVGTGAIEAIVRAREESGVFKSLEDFCTRVDIAAVNKRVLESLSKCGVFDEFQIDRGRLIASLDRIAAFAAHMNRQRSSAQSSFFGGGEQPAALLQLAVADPTTVESCLEWEFELLGIHFSPHPMSESIKRLSELGVTVAEELSDDDAGKRMKVGGIIREFREITTRQGQVMATFRLAGLRAALPVVVFHQVYPKVRSLLNEGQMIVVDGRCEISDGQFRLVTYGSTTLEEVQNQKNGSVSTPAGTGANGYGRRPREAVRKNGLSANGVGSQSSGRHLSIQILCGEDRNTDLQRIEQVYAALQSERGGDEVEMVVRRGPRSLPLSLPIKTTAMTQRLEESLSRLLPTGLGSWQCEPAGQMEHSVGVHATDRHR